MKTYLDNLRPFEKRLVVGVGTMLFIVLNLWFVVPHFSDWSVNDRRMNRARKKLDDYKAEIRQRPKIEIEVKKLQREGEEVPAEDQALHFANTVQSQAAQAQVRILNASRVTAGKTNESFLEQTQSINTQSKEQNLVDFLYNLGAGNSLIRVRDLTLRPDAPHQELAAGIKLVASYQRKKPLKGAAPAAKTTPAKSAPPTSQPAPATTKAPTTAPKQSTPAPKTNSPPPKPSTSNTKKP